jgi:hypothetical protein
VWSNRFAPSGVGGFFVQGGSSLLGGTIGGGSTCEKWVGQGGDAGWGLGRGMGSRGCTTGKIFEITDART